MPQPIYLDHAAATPVDPRVQAAMLPYLEQQFHNPSATYRPALDVHRALEKARADVAHWLGARPSEVTFTAGGTEANNLALFGVARQFPGARLISTAIEHASILEPLAALQTEGWPVTLLNPSPAGLIDPATMAEAIDDQTVLVSIGYANNEIGTVQPIRKIAQVLEAIRRDRRRRGVELPLYFHSDACQAANYLDLHVARLGVDLLTINGGKIYGPKQSGVLYVKAGLSLQPIIFGGGQEHGLRSGTENVAASIGLAAALELAQSQRHEETERLQKLQQLFVELLAEKVPQAEVNGSLKQRLPNNIHLTIPGCDNERLLIELDEHGIQAAAGSACSASDEEPSHVLRAIGLSDAAAQASLRFTMGRSTAEADIIRTVEFLSTLINTS